MPDLASLRFLSPAAGLAALSVGLPILLLFYFLKLRRRPVRVSSAMIWRDAARDLQVNVPWRLIRPSWLLILQVLVLALLCGALARPVLDLAASPPAHTIIVIDHSASMGARETPDGPTRLERAKDEARALVARLGDASQPVGFTILSYAARPAVRYAEGSDAGAARAAIAAIEQSDEPGDMAGVLQLLKALTATPAGDSPERRARPVRVVFLSDGNDVARLAGERGRELTGLGDVDFEFVPVAPEQGEAGNAGITALAARRDYDDPTLVRVFTAIESSARESRMTSLSATFTAFDAGAPVEIGAWAIRVGGATQDGPGRVTRSFDLVSPGGGVLKVSLRGADALAADDAAWLTLGDPKPPRVWLIRPEETPETAASASLRDAIEAVVGEAPRSLTAGEYAARVGAETPDLLVFDGVAPDALPPVPSISFGAGLPIPGLILEQGAGPTQVAFWTRSDPLMRGVTFPGTTVFEPRTITLPDTEAADGLVRSARVVARGTEGALIVALRDAAPRVVVGFGPDDTNWWRDPSFPIFIANAIETLWRSVGESGDDGRVVRTGESVTIPAWPGGERAVLSGPGGFERGLSPSEGSVSLGSLPRVGVYRVSGAGVDGVDAGSFVLAASLLDPIETSLSSSRDLSIAGRTIAGSGVEELAPREVWHWFVIAAVVLLAVEWFAYALPMRV